ncbi:MAG: muconolactone Delta-isomerase family protein [Deltaproteobacteria bacterium]
MKYLVMGTEGPGFYSPEEAMDVLENVVIPTFDELKELEDEGTIVGGVPVGERSFVFIAEAESNDDLDRILRALPAWGVLEWEVTPVQDLEARASIERQILKDLKTGS